MTRIQFLLAVLFVVPAMSVHAQSSPPNWPGRPPAGVGSNSAPTQPSQWDPGTARTPRANVYPSLPTAPNYVAIQSRADIPTSLGSNSNSLIGHQLSGSENLHVPPSAPLPNNLHDQRLSGFGWSSQQVWGPETNSPIQLAIEPEPDSAIRQAGSAHWDDGPQNMSLDPNGFISQDLCDSCDTASDCLEGSDLCGDPMNVFRPTRAAITWLYGDGDHLGITHFALRRSLDIPEFNFLVTPGIDVRFLDGPRTPDLPSRLYTAFVDLNYEQQYDPNWTYQLGLRPMVATDADHADQSALRLGARFVLFHRLFERMEMVAGVYYYDREDVPLLPTLGLIYKPDENTRWHLVFPNPRLSSRFMKTDNFDLWMYQAFEFGGGTWAIERATGNDDTFSYRDWRWLTGLELSAANGRRYFLEVGLVFRRKVEYRSFGGDYKPANTGMLRAGMVW